MEAVWNSIKNAVKEKIPDHCYQMWIEPIQFDKTLVGSYVNWGIIGKRTPRHAMISFLDWWPQWLADWARDPDHPLRIRIPVYEEWILQMAEHFRGEVDIWKFNWESPRREYDARIGKACHRIRHLRWLDEGVLSLTDLSPLQLEGAVRLVAASGISSEAKVRVYGQLLSDAPRGNASSRWAALWKLAEIRNEAADALLRSILADWRDTAIVLGFPSINQEATTLLTSYGFSPTPSCHRMIYGNKTASGQPERIFAIANGATG